MTAKSAASLPAGLERGWLPAVLVLVAVALAYRCTVDAGIPFLWPGGDARWITAPARVDALPQQHGEADVPVARFARDFTLAEAAPPAALRVQAARAFRASLDGTPLGASDDPDWRRPRALEIGPLAPGPHRIEIEVWNPRGPPLLRVRVEPTGAHETLGALGSDARWRVSLDDAAPEPAAVPDDTRSHPSAAAGPRPGRALRDHASLLLGLLLGAALAWSLAGSRGADLAPRAPALALAGVHVLWLYLFVAKWLEIPLTTGFDARHHLAYVEALREGRLPRPDEGWSTYHPPLYYLLHAGLRETLGALGPTWDRVAAKAISFAAGLGQVWLAWGLARRLRPRSPGFAAVAVLFAGLLPLNLYTSAYVSNEPLHAVLFGAVASATVALLLRPGIRLRDGLLWGALCGLALLTKVTALVVLGVGGIFLLWKTLGLERRGAAATAGWSVTAALPVLAIAGWFYARNVWLYGTPLVGNWNLPGMVWWSQPGFHTPAYYLGFGEALRRPLLSGFHSFGDAIYSSFWGDGWIAGRASAAVPPEAWNQDFVVLGYWLALPLSGLGLWGAARLLGAARSHPEPHRRLAWRFLLCVQAALGLAVVWLTLALPFFGQAKAPYLLGLVAPLATTFALGWETCERRLAPWPAARSGLRAFLSVAGAVFALSFAA